MRISDWSSDVCSSDLCIPISGAGLRARMPVVGVIEKLSERYAVPSDHRRHVSWDSHRRRPMMSEPFDPADTDAWRSEEHTSELQSLMRISYAVFCLKKKKKNDTINK